MSALAAAVEPVQPSNGDASIAVLTSLLEQLRDVLTLLPAGVYRAQPAARVSGSVGAHVRHALDHIDALAEAVAGAALSYDHRRRGTTVETEPVTAVTEIERLLFRIDRLPACAFDRSVTFATLLHADLQSASVRSTLAREAAFVIQHTVHHCALIALLLEWQDYRVPYGFGVAASTQRARGAVG